MQIRDLKGNLHIVNREDLYIKPVYGETDVIKYSICHNLGNEEVEVVSYTDYTIAKHMLRLLGAYSIVNKKQEMEACCFSEVEIAKDLLLAAEERLKRVVKKTKEVEKIERVCGE